MVLVVSSLKKSFGPRVLWENIDLRAERGTLTGLIGASGSGKSTLLNCIGLLTAPDGGRISYEGVELLDMGSARRRIFRRDTLGYLFQNYALMEDATVKENLAVAMRGRKDTGRMREALESVGLADRLNTRVATLSGGEQQRVALARIMVKAAKLILADEPTGALDPTNAGIVMGHIRAIADQGACVVIATHDPFVMDGCDQLLNLDEGA